MEALKKLIEEHSPPAEPVAPPPSRVSSETEAEDASGVDSSKQESVARVQVPEGGSLLIFGSIDWENVTSKACEGLDSPHLITSFPAKVMKTFSSSSSRHFFILLLDGSLYGMGFNDRGQLGTGDTRTYQSPIRIPQFGSSPIQKIATGRFHSLFLLENGEIYGCGSNSCGQLGMGTCEQLLVPTILPLDDIQDIACGFEHSLVCTRAQGLLYAFGHPEYGQLGDGGTGEYIKQAQKVSYNFVTKPKLIRSFLTKDQRGDVAKTISADEIRIRCVSAGRNHSCCLEDWEDENGNEVPNRVYSWGFGGYGRLGHSCASDEHVPREIVLFSPPPGRAQFPQKQIRQLYCGSTYSLFLSKTNNLYFNGILPNSPRKEACTYPRIQQELYDWSTKQLSGGSSWILICADTSAIYWGVPVAGTFGLENDLKRSATPVMVSAVSDMRVLDISSGHCHGCIVVAPPTENDSTSVSTNEDNFQTKLQSFPLLPTEDRSNEEMEAAGRGKGKKRGPAASTASNKKGKKK